MDDGALAFLDDELLGQPAVSLTGIDFSNLLGEFDEPSPEPQPKRRQQQQHGEEAAARLEKERAKNRRAQARYRQRQREQREGLAREHAATTTQLHQTREEHAELRHSNSILEALLAVRTDTLGLLERAKAEDAVEQASGSDNGSSGAQPGGGLLLGSDAQCGSGSSGWHGATTLGTAPGAAAAAVAVDAIPGGGSSSGSSGVVPAVSGSAAGSKDASKGGCGGSGMAGGALAEPPPAEGVQQGTAPCSTVGQWLPPFTYHYGFADNEVDAHQLQLPVGPEALEAARLIEGHRQFAGRVRELLAEYDATGSDKVLERLRPLMVERSLLMAAALRHRPAAVLELFASCAEPGLSEEQQREKWDGVAAALRVSPAQWERYVKLSDAYLQRVEQLQLQKREALTALLQASMGGTAALSGQQGMAAGHMQARSGAALLHAAADSEFSALLQLLSEMGRVFTPLQKARSAAMSWPRFPDILQIMEAVRRLPVA